MPHHALEITLTRPATPAELEQAHRLMPLGTNHDRTRLMALTPAKTPCRAPKRLRQTLDDALPVDPLATHYPDTHGQVTLNVAFTPAAAATVRRAASAHGQDAETFVQEAVIDALVRADHQEAERLAQAMQTLLSATTRERRLTAAQALAIPEARPC